MGSERSMVITAYGHDKTIDKISVSSFDIPDVHSAYSVNSNAQRYCDAINGLELKDNTWIFAQIVSENTPYTLDAFSPPQFDVFLTLDDRSIQKVLRETDSQDLAKALKGAAEPVKEKIFNNMSERAIQMIKEDMEYMGPVRTSNVKESQEKIVSIIRHLEQTGEIIFNFKE
jgi:lysine/ornithine N-monooxygenase